MQSLPEDRYFSRLLWYILAGTVGGANRLRILRLLKERPYNTNQIAMELSIHYKTVQHHLKVLSENSMISRSEGTGYGSLFFLTPLMQNHLDVLEQIWSKVREKEIRDMGGEEGRY